MAKKSHSVKHDRNGKEVMKQRSSKYKVPTPTPPPPPHCYINLCFPNEDMLEVKRKYKVLRPPAVTSKDHFKNLGFLGGCDTLMYVSHKKAKFPGKSLYALGRSWFKEVVTEKDKCASTEMNKKQKCHRSDDAEAKAYLKEFVEQAKAAKVLARLSRKKGKMVQKQVLSTSAPRGGKKKLKIRSLKDILRAIDQERAS